MQKHILRAESSVIDEICRTKSSTGPVVLVVDSFLASGKLLPLSILLSEKGIAFKYWYNNRFNVLPQFVDFEKLSGIPIEKQDLSGDLNTDFSSGLVLKCLRLIGGLFHRVHAPKVLQDLISGLTWRTSVRCLLAREGASLVITVLNANFSLSRIALAEARKKHIPAMNIIGRAMARSEYLFYQKHPNNKDIFWVRPYWLTALLKLLLKPGCYDVQSDGTILLPAVLPNVLATRIFLPEDNELFWPVSAYADANYFHPAVLNELQPGEVMLENRCITAVFPEEQVLECDGQYSKLMREIQDRKKREGVRVIVTSYADLFSEKAVPTRMDEVNLQEKLIRMLCSLERTLVVVTRHPRMLFATLQERLSNLKLDNLVVTPYTGLMLLPYADGCVMFPFSELNVYAESYGIPSLIANLTKLPFIYDLYEFKKKRKRHTAVQADSFESLRKLLMKEFQPRSETANLS